MFLIIGQESYKILREATAPKPNYNKANKLAAKQLKDNKDILILRADKGNATVLMKSNEYEEKMNKIIEEGPYKIIKKNPINKIIKNVNAGIKNGITDTKLRKQLTVSVPSIPRIYRVPKIHKTGTPLRPIVSSINSPTYNLEGHLAQILKQKTR